MNQMDDALFIFVIYFRGLSYILLFDDSLSLFLRQLNRINLLELELLCSAAPFDLCLDLWLRGWL